VTWNFRQSPAAALRCVSRCCSARPRAGEAHTAAGCLRRQPEHSNCNQPPLVSVCPALKTGRKSSQHHNETSILPPAEFRPVPQLAESPVPPAGRKSCRPLLLGRRGLQPRRPAVGPQGGPPAEGTSAAQNVVGSPSDLQQPPLQPHPNRQLNQRPERHRKNEDVI
jgi:hypothetical protein